MAGERRPQAPRELAGGSALQTAYSDCSAARLYTAAVQAATELGFAINSQDSATMTLSFRTSVPTTSWRGPEFTATIRPQGDAARIMVVGRRIGGYRLAIADWHQAKAIGLMFLDRLTSVLPRVPESAASVVTGPSAADQLEALTDLRDRGFLTEDEFVEAKNKLPRGTAAQA